LRKVVLGLTVLTGVFTAVFLYERLSTMKTFGPSAMLATTFLLVVFGTLAATYVLYGTRHRQLVVNMWLAATTFVVMYVVLDLAAGFVLIRPLSPPLIPDAYRHHKLLPNSYARLAQRDFSYVQRVNNVGLRGRDVAPVKPADTYRILMLGDSFTMGKGVEDELTFSVLLEQALNGEANACPGKTIEVLNGGVDSYAPVLSLIQLTRDLHTLSPDMVIHNLDMSDLVQEAAYRKEAVIGADGQIAAVPQGEERTSLTERVTGWIDRRLFFTRAALYYVNRAAGYRGITVRNVTTQADRQVLAHTLAGDTEPRDEQWRDLFDSIKRIKEFCAARGISYVLSIYPWAHQISATEWVPGREAFLPPNAVPSDASVTRIRQFAAAEGIDLADVYPEFRQYQGKEPLYFSHDMHWTAAGNQLMARGLERHLKERNAPFLCR
jgi:hypothetical protein